MAGMPLRTVDVWLKQIDHTQVNTLGRAALDFAFPKFAIPPTARTDHLGFLRPVRRFAGDTSLPRGRYFALAHDETGWDDGTLACELYAYRDPRSAAPIEIYDSTAPEQIHLKEYVFQEMGCHGIVVRFPMHDGKPHPFARQQGHDVPFEVLLPLSLRRESIEGVIDLRERDVGEWFTQHFTGLKTDIPADVSVPVWPLRPPLQSFFELLPTLLAQERGGDNFGMAVGTWLRRHDVNGMIYPSARRDCGVIYTEGKPTHWEGWNFVDYRGAKKPRLYQVLGNQVEWDDVVCIGPEDPADSRSRVACSGIRIGARQDPDDPHYGSWQVTGLTGREREYPEDSMSEPPSKGRIRSWLRKLFG